MTRLEAFALKKGWTYAELGRRLGGITWQRARNYCLPKGDPNRNQPNDEIGEKLKRLTNGEVHLGNYADEMPDDVVRALPERRRGRRSKKGAANV